MIYSLSSVLSLQSIGGRSFFSFPIGTVWVYWDNKFDVPFKHKATLIQLLSLQNLIANCCFVLSNKASYMLNIRETTAVVKKLRYFVISSVKNNTSCKYFGLPTTGITKQETEVLLHSHTKILHELNRNFVWNVIPQYKSCHS